MNKLDPCPHCGVLDEVYVHARAYGWATQYYGVDGYQTQFDIDQVLYTDAKIIRCCSCQKVRRDLEVIADGVRQRGSPHV